MPAGAASISPPRRVTGQAWRIGGRREGVASIQKILLKKHIFRMLCWTPGVLIFQFLERVPDRQATELVKYHLGWKLALNLKLGAEGFHPTSLVHFRQRLVEAGKSDLALSAVLKALEQEGFIAKRSKQRLDSTHILGAVARLSALECVRETLALALEELDGILPKDERPDFWERLWERYVESKLDYKSTAEVLQSKRRHFPFLIQGTVIRSANFVRLALGSINAGTPLTDRLTPGTVGFDLLPGRLSLALRRWIMGVPCFGVEPSTT